MMHGFTASVSDGILKVRQAAVYRDLLQVYFYLKSSILFYWK